MAWFNLQLRPMQILGPMQKKAKKKQKNPIQIQCIQCKKKSFKTSSVCVAAAQKAAMSPCWLHKGIPLPVQICV